MEDKDQQILNLQIAYELLDFLLDNPELRFIQALWALEIEDGSDRFHEPSGETLKRVKLRIQKDLERKGESKNGDK